jgi:lipopolysaccharide transport system ATP-binding protein
MRRREINRKFEEIVEFAEIGPFIDTPVKHYSSGMYLRLAFAIAAHLEPEILIVDEVLAVGDFGFQKKCLGKMSDVAQQGRTILFVSHNLVALRSLCQRGILLDQGEVTAVGSIDSVVQTYVQQFSTTRLEWLATGEEAINSPVQLLAVRLLTAPPVDPRRLTVADPFSIEVVYQSDLTDGLLQVSLVLENVEGVCVFNARSQPQRFARGQVRQRCQIPANLLNDDSYTLRVILIQDTNLGLLDRSNLLHFDIHDTERQGAWYGKWIGAVRPQFEWVEEVTSFVRGE